MEITHAAAKDATAILALQRLAYRQFKRERVHDRITLIFLEKTA